MELRRSSSTQNLEYLCRVDKFYKQARGRDIMPEDLKIITFSKDNLNGLESLRLYTKNELVRGLLDIVLRNRLANREFDCNDDKFKRILNELIEEYTDLKQKATYGRIKNINTELERLILETCGLLEFTARELLLDKPNEKILTKYLAQLTKNTNEITTNYSVVIQPPKKSMMQKLRESKLTKWIIGGAVGASLAGGVYAATGSKDNENVTNSNSNAKKIEVKAEIKKDVPPTTKVMTAKELNSKLELEKDSVKKLQLEKLRNEYELVQKNRKQTIAKVKQILSKIEMPADYIKPKHVMALMWAETRFDPTATNGNNVRGIMQISSSSVSMDLEKNIREGIKRIKEKEQYCRTQHPDWDKLSNDKKIQIIFAAYNCGQTRLDLTYNWKVRDSNDETESHDQAIWDYINHLYKP
jgi:hypothetical protein